MPNVYIDAKTLLQSGLADQLAQISPSVAAQLDQAAATGGAISIPTEEYATRIAPTDVAPQLLEHLRTGPNEFSKAEAVQWMEANAEEVKAATESALAEAQAAAQDSDAFAASAGVVRNRLLEQLNAAGNFTPDVNDMYAALITSRVATRARQLGMSPEQFFERYPLRVVGPGQVAGNVFSQALASQPPKGWVHATDGSAAAALWDAPASDTGAVFWTDLQGKLAQDAPQLAGYSHSLDRSTIEHIRKEHGDANAEAKRGQIGITGEDLARIPEIVTQYDAMRDDLQSIQGTQRRAYAKRYADGVVVYVEDVSRKRSDMRGVTMFKVRSDADPAQVLARQFDVLAKKDKGPANAEPKGDALRPLLDYESNAQTPSPNASVDQDDAESNPLSWDEQYERGLEAIRGVELDAQALQAAIDAYNSRALDDDAVRFIEEEIDHEASEHGTVDGRAIPVDDLERDEDGDITDAGMEAYYVRRDAMVEAAVQEELERRRATDAGGIDNADVPAAVEKAAMAYLDAAGIAYRETGSGFSRYLLIEPRQQSEDEAPPTLKLRFADHENQTRSYEHKNTLWQWVTERRGETFADMMRLATLYHNGIAQVGEQYNQAAKERASFYETERAYGGMPAWERARAAGRTNLNYRQWVQVRTPEFKAWFGDWEAASLHDFLNGEPVATLEGNQAPRTGFADLRQWATDLFKQQGGKATHPELGDVALDERAVRDSIGHGMSRKKADAFAAVKSVIEQGRIVAQEQRSKSTIGLYISAPVRIGQVDDIVTVLVHRDPNTQRMYLHSVTTKESLLDQADKSSADTNVAQPSGTPSRGGAFSVLRNALNVNPSEVSRVTDPETGEPLVVYHNTDEDFDTFRLELARQSADIPAFYFAKNRNEAAEYGKNTIAAFLNIRNPTENPPLANMNGRAIREQLEAEGFDGTINYENIVQDDDLVEFAAFNGNQIKSATGNTGEFSAGNGNIYHQWYRSELAQAIPAMAKIADKEGRIGVAQAQAWLAARQKEGKFKQEELEWSGLPEWLNAQDGKVAVADIEAFLNEGGVQVKEVEKNGTVRLFAGHDSSDNYNEYGSMQEALAALEAERLRIINDNMPGDIEEEDGGFAFWSDLESESLWFETLEEAEQARQADIDRLNSEEYTQILPGFDVGDQDGFVLARDGDIVSTAYETEDEIEGTKYKSYATEGGKNYREVLLTLPQGDGYKSAHWDERNILAHVRLSDFTDAQGNKTLFVEEIQSDWAQDKRKDKDVPDAPFIKNTKDWTALALKRIAALAVEGGYKNVAFINGKQSADRYKLSSHVSEVELDKKQASGDAVLFIAYGKKGETVIRRAVNDEAELADYIGKELAGKLWDEVQGSDTGTASASGVDMDIGGEGMMAFYDQIVPNVAKTVLKKIGGKGLVEVEIPGVGTQSGFEVTGEMAEQAERGFSLFSRAGQAAPRGAFNPEQMTIALLQGADLSTFLHESGHFFFESDVNLAAEIVTSQREGASLSEGEQQILSDVDTLLGWHGLQGTLSEKLNQWLAMPFEEKRALHERTAEAFERYLFEGKAPSIELAQYFQKFRAWLLNVYSSIKRFLEGHPEAGKLSDEVRGVFDRMLASQEEIALAERARSMIPLFETAEQSGMTPEEWKRYQAETGQATAQAVEQLQARSLRDMQWYRNARSRVLKRLKKEVKELRDEVQMQVRSEVMQQPVYQAWQYLRSRDEENAGKLSRKALVDMYGGAGVDGQLDRYALLDWKRLNDLRMTDDEEGLHRWGCFLRRLGLHCRLSAGLKRRTHNPKGLVLLALGPFFDGPLLCRPALAPLSIALSGTVFTSAARCKSKKRRLFREFPGRPGLDRRSRASGLNCTHRAILRASVDTAVALCLARVASGGLPISSPLVRPLPE